MGGRVRGCVWARRVVPLAPISRERSGWATVMWATAQNAALLCLALPGLPWVMLLLWGLGLVARLQDGV